jgi:hypothetical protein
MRVFQSRDCYSSPEAIYRSARARGMDLVTITDHNSVDGCVELIERHPDATDILMGEEIECRVPGTGSLVHLGALGLTERHHLNVQALRGSVFEAAAFLRSEGVALVLHHPVHLFEADVDARWSYLERCSPCARRGGGNATMMAAHNDLAAAITAAERPRPACPPRADGRGVTRTCCVTSARPSPRRLPAHGTSSSRA